MSFTSSIHSSHGVASGGGGGGSLLADRAQKAAMGPKVEVVYNLLTMLFSHDRHNVSQKLLHMSTNPETRSTLHQVGQYYSAQMSIYRTLLLIQFASLNCRLYTAAGSTDLQPGRQQRNRFRPSRSIQSK